MQVWTTKGYFMNAREAMWMYDEDMMVLFRHLPFVYRGHELNTYEYSSMCKALSVQNVEGN